MKALNYGLSSHLRAIKSLLRETHYICDNLISMILSATMRYHSRRIWWHLKIFSYSVNFMTYTIVFRMHFRWRGYDICRNISERYFSIIQLIIFRLVVHFLDKSPHNCKLFNIINELICDVFHSDSSSSVIYEYRFFFLVFSFRI